MRVLLSVGLDTRESKPTPKADCYETQGRVHKSCRVAISRTTSRGHGRQKLSFETASKGRPSIMRFSGGIRAQGLTRSKDKGNPICNQLEGATSFLNLVGTWLGECVPRRRMIGMPTAQPSKGSVQDCQCELTGQRCHIRQMVGFRSARPHRETRS
jgi:hypothetical protein